MNQMRPSPASAPAPSAPVAPGPVTPELRLEQLFATSSARRGAVLRRGVDWVDAHVGRARLIAEVRRRGWHMIENRGYYLILCNTEGVKIVC